jgi:hypothetical protein
MKKHIKLISIVAASLLLITIGIITGCKKEESSSNLDKQTQESFKELEKMMELSNQRENEKKQFESEVDGFKLSYLVKPNTYLCRLQNHDTSGNSYEIEFPIPDSEEEKLQTLIELFAQSEAGRIS